MRYSLLLVDDDPLIHELVKRFLPEHWNLFSVFTTDIPFPTRYHAALVDLHLTNGDLKIFDGLSAIKKIVEKSPATEIIAASGDLDRASMESCLRAGALKFLAKPFVREEFSDLLAKIEAHWQLKDLHFNRRGGRALTPLLGQTPAMEKLRRSISVLHREPGPILIEGETGTGKELVARLLHEQGDEASPGARPWVQVNIASIPEHLFESEIFGHVRGAFTGAEQNKIGLAQAAHGGDLFFDEIEALPLHHQVKLLRFLDSGETRRVGSNDVIRVQTRVIVASNERLRKLVEQNKFREDLYFRLEAKKITVPPLRDRLDDIEHLAKRFLERENNHATRTLTEDGLVEFQKYHWPGNVRELKRVCEQLALVSPLPLIRGEDVRKFIFQSAQVNDTLSYEGGLSYQVGRFEAAVIENCLRDLGHIDKASEALGISRSHLYKKIKDYQIRI